VALLGILGLIIFVIGIAALFKGEIPQLRISNRKIAGLVVVAGLVVFFVAVAATDTEETPVAENEIEETVVPDEEDKEKDPEKEDEPLEENGEPAEDEKDEDTEEKPELKAYCFDVGQADATLLKGQEAKILIDAGHWQRSEVVSHLNSANVERIDKFIATHPHADHIGQADEVLNSFEIGKVWICGNEHDTQTYEDFVEAKEGENVRKPRKGEEYEVGNMEIEILNPASLTGDLHRDCLSLRIEYGEVSFLFTGDAEEDAEMAMLNSEQSLDADIYQLGHHGSRTSSNRPFLREVDPEVGIYSAGEDNEYGHPHDRITDKFDDKSIDMHGTKEYGTIKVITDGVDFEVVK